MCSQHAADLAKTASNEFYTRVEALAWRSPAMFPNERIQLQQSSVLPKNKALAIAASDVSVVSRNRHLQTYTGNVCVLEFVEKKDS
jgi:hypothetical protein